MVGVASDPVTLLEVVCGGERLWRQRFGRAFRGLVPGSLSTDGMADSVFRFFCRRVVTGFPEFMPGTPPEVILDAIEPVTPPTQKEIDESWVVESASSEEGRREFYGVGGHPLEHILRGDHGE